MHTVNIWHKLHLHWGKVILVILLSLLSFSHVTHAQKSVQINLPHYDDRWLHYGFLIGLHVSSYRIQHSERFTSPDFDSLRVVIPGSKAGFKLGFVANIKLAQYLDFRFTPMVGFYENTLTYEFIDGTEPVVEVKDATLVEFPLLLKYKSQRRGNVRMYLVGGINPQIEASGKGDEQDNQVRLQTRDFDVHVELGVGFDLFYELFKFSPEFRYSFGLRNMLNDEVNRFSEPLQRVSTHNFTLYITFEGGPS